MKTHHVKSWKHFFQAIKDGSKKHDLRMNDRDFNVGDHLILEEYDNINGEYTGDKCRAMVTYITDTRVPCAFSSAALDRKFSILSLEVISRD